MKKPAKETLKLAVERLFIRVHSNMFLLIDEFEKMDFDPLSVVYDADNNVHAELIRLYKLEIGYNIVATDRDIFFSILTVYANAKKEDVERQRLNEMRGSVFK